MSAFSFNASNIADTTNGFSVSVKLPLDVNNSFNSLDFSILLLSQLLLMEFH